MLSHRRCRNYRDGLSNIVGEVINFAQNSVLKALPPLDPNRLCLDMFGSKTPVTLHHEVTPQFAAINALYPNPKVAPLQNLVPTPEVISTQSLYVPVLPSFALKVAGLKDAQSLDCFTYVHYASWRAEKPGIAEIANQEFPEAVVDYCRRILLDHIGEEHLAALDRVLALRTLLNPLPLALSHYAAQCRSLGGLFHHLPTLSSLFPNASQKAEHVTMTRLTPDPPPDLVQGLALLATLYAALKASSPTDRRR